MLIVVAALLLSPGPALRAFDYDPSQPFQAGSHRGVDVAVQPGERVRAPCAGTIAFAGRAPSERAVTVRCGRWRVTLLPLATLAVARGRSVARGDILGRATGSHPGLHIGVRRAGDRFGYVDPLTVLERPDAPPAAPIAPPLARRPRPARPRAAPRAPRPHPGPSPAPLPWPVVLGAALLAVAAPLPAIRLRRRRRRHRAAVAARTA